MADLIAENGEYVKSLEGSLRHGSVNISMVPDLLRHVLEGERWRHFSIKGREVEHDSFESFVATPPLGGLGASVDQLKRLVGDDPVLLDGIDAAAQRRPGRPRKGEETPDIVRDYGNSTDGALRRLRKDRPDLHAQVLDKQMSPHAAMVEAGFRPRTCTVRLDDPKRAAQTLIRNASPEFVRSLKEALT